MFVLGLRPAEFLGYCADDRSRAPGLADRASATLFQIDAELDAAGILDSEAASALEELAWGMLSYPDLGTDD